MRQWIQITKETSIGTTPTADGTNSIWIDIEETDPGITVTPSMFNIRTALPKRGVTNRISGSGSDSVAGTLSTALYHEHASFWNDAVFKPSIRNTDEPYLPTYTINRAWRDDTWTSRVEQYKRCVFQAATITGTNAQGSDPIRLQLTVIGGEFNSGASLSAPACTVYPDELYLWPMTDFELNDISLKSYVRSVSLTIAHTVTPRRHMNRYPDGYTYSSWAPSFSVEMDMFSHAYREQYLDIRTAFADAIYATNNALTFTYAVDKIIKFDFYNAMFSALDPQRPPNGDHTQSATIVPFYDCTNMDLTCTVTNPS